MRSESARFAKRVFPATSIKNGNIALPPSELGKQMDRETFRRHLHCALRDLSLQACREAVADWGKPPLLRSLSSVC